MWILTVSDAGGQNVTRVPLNSGAVTVGRDAHCSVVLTHARVGGVHARIDVCDEAHLLYTDEGSPGGSRLNGVPVQGAVFLDDGKTVEIPGYRISAQRIGLKSRSPSPPVIVPVGESVDDDPIARELERQIRSIQSHREEVQKHVESRRERLDRGWSEAVASARRLQAKMNGDSRVQHFVISRDGSEVAVKLTARGEKLGYRYFILSRNHPDGKYPSLDMVWLREFGRDDASFEDPQKAMTELVQRIAGTLA